MKLLSEITEHEMIAEFLKAEYSSARFGDKLKELLNKNNINHDLIKIPSIHNSSENVARKELFWEYRGYGKNEWIFENFPHDIKWFWAICSIEELKRVKYISYSYWDEITNWSRLALDGANTIKSWKTIFNQSNDGFWKCAEAVKKWTEFPPLILVTNKDEENIIVLEGHLRITAYMLVLDYMPENIPVIIGYSDDITAWDEF